MFTTPKTSLMWAFGSNLNVDQMHRRCPAARPLEPLAVPNAVLRFRSVADVAYLRGAECPGGLWRITRACEAALDRYEGYRADGSGLYAKRYLTVAYHGERVKVLYYQMTTLGIFPPSRGYYDVIARGYADFGLDLEPLERALEHAWDRQRKTTGIARRYALKGRPKLARPTTDHRKTGQLAFDHESFDRWSPWLKRAEGETR